MVSPFEADLARSNENQGITKRHQGPIVRINPEELHCDDYDFVDEIYPSVANRIRDKHPHFLNAFAGTLTVSTFTTPDHEVCLCVERACIHAPPPRAKTQLLTARQRRTASEGAPSASSFPGKECSDMSQKFTRWRRKCATKSCKSPDRARS